MLEIFSSEEQISRHIESYFFIRQFLEDVYSYLVKRKYFRLVCQMLEDKVPPLYGPVLNAPNSISDTLFQMILQPLKLVNSCTGCSKLILSSFTEQILAPIHSDPIKYFVIPCLVNHSTFPYLFLLKYLVEEICNSNANGQSNAQSNDGNIMTSFLLNAFLKLDQIHLNEIYNAEYLADYIRIISSLATNINKLPRKTDRTVFRNEDSSDSDTDDHHKIDMESMEEMECLLEIVKMLNEQIRAQLIVDNVEEMFLENPIVLHALCKICHYLMMYHRSAIFDYKQV